MLPTPPSSQSPAQLAVFFIGAAVCTAGILLLLLQKEGSGGDGSAGAGAGAESSLIDDAEAAGRRAWEEGRADTGDDSVAAAAGAAGSQLAAARAASASAQPEGGGASARGLDAGFVASPSDEPWYLREIAPMVRGALRQLRARAAQPAKAGGGAAAFTPLGSS